MKPLLVKSSFPGAILTTIAQTLTPLPLSLEGRGGPSNLARVLDFYLVPINSVRKRTIHTPSRKCQYIAQ